MVLTTCIFVCSHVSGLDNLVFLYVFMSVVLTIVFLYVSVRFHVIGLENPVSVCFYVSGHYACFHVSGLDNLCFSMFLCQWSWHPCISVYFHVSDLDKPVFLYVFMSMVSTALCFSMF